MTRLSPNVPFSARYVETESGCWEWIGGRFRDGYGRYGRRHASRVSYELARGPIPDGMFVCHKCDNPPCVNPAHLFLGSHADNMRDMVLKGRAHHLNWSGKRRGEHNPRAKLTAENVLEIRGLRGMVSHAKLAVRFSVAPSLISMIQAGLQWKEGPFPND